MGFQDTYTKNKSMGRIRSDRGPSRTTLQPVRVSWKPERHETKPPARSPDDLLPQETDPPAAGIGAGPPDVQPQQTGDAAQWIERTEPGGWQVLERADMAGLEIIDLPAPCEKCGGIDVWRDVAGGLHCVTCNPAPDTGERLRRLAAQARSRYPNRRGKRP